MPFVTLGNADLYYEAAGPAVAPAVVLLQEHWTELIPGQFTTLLQEQISWREQVIALAANHRVLALDLPGHGSSDLVAGIDQYTAERYAALVAELLTHLGVERAHVAGHAFGGVVALSFAVQFPAMLNALVLADTSPEPLPAETRSALGKLLPGADAAVVHPDSTTAWLRFEGLEARLQYITAPALVIAGESDSPFFQQGAELLHGWIPFSRLVRIPGAGHAPQQEAPDAFNAELLGFLHEVETSV